MKKQITLCVVIAISITLLSSCASNTPTSAEGVATEKKEQSKKKNSRDCPKATTGSRMRRC